MITIEVMTKKDCCLCDDAKEIIEQVIGEFPAEMRMTDIESDSELSCARNWKKFWKIINYLMSYFDRLSMTYLHKEELW
jgi:hypothetical protein